MTTADQLALVERHLCGAVRACALADCGLVQGWMKARRLAVVVQHGGDHALFLFVSASFPVSAADDLAVDAAVPIGRDFK